MSSTAQGKCSSPLKIIEIPGFDIAGGDGDFSKIIHNVSLEEARELAKEKLVNHGDVATYVALTRNLHIKYDRKDNKRRLFFEERLTTFIAAEGSQTHDC